MARNSTALVQTFEKGLQLLEYLVEHKVVSVTSIAKLMGIQKSASYRFLNTLRLHGYVEQDQHNNYILTDKVSKMGNGIVPRMEFRHIVSRFLDELAKRNCKDGICNLGKWNGKEIVYEVQSANFEYVQYSVGRTVPAYCSALGKAILAHLPEAALATYIQRTPMEGFTEKTCTTEERLRAELPEARLVLQVHDELIVECPEPQAERAAALLKEEMERVVTLSVPLTADAHWGKNWLEAKG